MKRFERYAAQVEFVRRAAFVLTLRHGSHAVTRRSVAAALGISDATVRRVVPDDADLAEFAAAECETRRRRSALQRRTEVEHLLPDAEDAEVELVWLRLELAHAGCPAGDRGAELRHDYHVAMRGWSDEPTTTTIGEDSGAVTGAENGEESGDEVVGHEVPESGLPGRFAEERDIRRRLVLRLVDDRADLVEPVLGCVDGLLLALAAGRLTTSQARGVLIDLLRALDVPVRSSTGRA